MQARVPASVTPVLILSGSSLSRVKATVFNHSSASLYLSTQPSASAQFFWVKLTSGSYFEVPDPGYIHEVYGAWDGANGYAMITDHQANDHPTE